MERIVDGISQLLKYAAAVLLILVSLLIAADVVLRFFFNSPIDGVAEIVANGIVVIAFMQLAYAVRINGMLRSEFVLDRLGPLGRRMLESLNALLGVLLFALIAWASWSPMARSIATGEFAGYAGFQMPVWPIRLAIEACSILAVVAYLLIALRSLLVGVDHPERPVVG
ncbi:TRAP transporter small permease subunit [Jiella avicenniae]|uniref:TRAP transporter small permease protein n=1 Tax=Jiella avicenniae TaxID=2907202 RepID=A0A9X1TCP8_9HYPH|nr:TRAP transporter small permease [Jiella avicenniae]MCE7029233.1 TRAP transporter small permease [Jiella avicenniae]